MLKSSESLSGVSSLSSASTFDFTELMDPDEPQLLSRSYSLEALPGISDDFFPPFDDVPSFDRRMFPIVPILLDEQFSKTPLKHRDALELIGDARITTSIPTTPRMTKILNEPLTVDYFLRRRTVDFEPFEHLPWQGIEYKESKDWVSEGSSFSPSDFARRLKTSRNRRKALESAILSDYTTDNQSTLGLSSPSREPLVFQREITLETDGEASQWSLQVPATSMNPEMIDMVLQLQHLNSYFKAGIEDLDHSVAVLGQEREKLEPPALMVSNSHCAIPLSLESSENLRTGPSISLAARRGKQDLPPLVLRATANQVIIDMDYPSIPTAFLGSPSAYSPKFDLVTATSDSSLNVVDMISGLRSQCASIQSQFQPGPDDGSFSGNGSIGPHVTAGDDTTSEWAFAEDLMAEFGGNINTSLLDLETMDELLPNDVHSPQHSTPCSSQTSFLSPQPLFLLSPKVTTPPCPPPSTPPPPPPSPTSGPSSPPKVRGILKNSKNVRFASLPQKERKKSMENIESPLFRPRHSVAAASSPSSRPVRPRLPLRPKSHSAVENIPPPAIVPTHRASPGNLTRTPNRPKPGIDRPVSAPSSTSRTTREIGSYGRTSLGSVSPQVTEKYAIRSLGRHSASKAKPGFGSERGRGTISCDFGPAKRVSTESKARRGSDVSEGTPKSRMPVPLRNILTRFK